MPTILTQESTTKSSNQIKEKEPDTKEPLITFQNTTGPAARNKRKRKAKSNKKKQQQPKTTLQTIAHVAYHGNAFNPDTQQIAQYFELSRFSRGHLWVETCEDEFGRLMNGNGEKMKTGTKTMKSIRVRDIPRGRFATYLRIVAAFRPEKENPRQIQFTAGEILSFNQEKQAQKQPTSQQ